MGDNDIIIRQATLTDAAGIAAILREVGWFSHINAEPPAQTEARVAASMELTQAHDRSTVLVAAGPDGELMGYVAVHWFANLMLGREAYISELFLRPAARGQGLGGRLLDEVKQQALARGCERLMLLNRRIRESYQRGFYPKHGWRERDDMACFMLSLTGQK